jgi:hypothetical protein
VTTRGVTLAALLAVLGRPVWWLLALAGFLARGGIVLFLLAIVTLPSPLALSNVVAPLLVPIVLGGVTPLLAAIVAFGVVSLVAFILAGALVGASTEVVLISDARHAAAEEGLPLRADRAPAGWAIVRVAVAGLVAHIPLAIAVALGSVQIVNVAYVELTAPVDIDTPLPLRVVGGAIGPIVVIILAWLVGEVTGGLAARRIVVGGGSTLGSVGRAYQDLLVRPRSALLPALGTTAVLAVDLAAMLAVVGLAWTAARAQLVQLPPDALGIGLALATFAAAWCLALFVTGLIAAWRSVAMTFEEERAAAAAEARTATTATIGADPGGGTFGASTTSRPGDWSAGNEGGSL